jgi:hypothetical protein
LLLFVRFALIVSTARACEEEVLYDVWWVLLSVMAQVIIVFGAEESTQKYDHDFGVDASSFA